MLQAEHTRRSAKTWDPRNPDERCGLGVQHRGEDGESGERPLDVLVRKGGPRDVDAVLALFDGAVRWLTDRGLTGQWGTAPFSTRPERMEQARGWGRSGGLRIADAAGTPVGAMVVGNSPVYVVPAREPDLYVQALVSSRDHPLGKGAGRLLLDHARAEAAERGLGLLRVDCWAGGGGALIRYYRSAGFTPTERFMVGDWQGQLLEQRVTADDRTRA
jgi:GNAT superfamily N-acetyltransferase